MTTKIVSFLYLLIIPFYIGGILFSEEMTLDLARDYALKNSTTMKLATEEKKIAYSQSVEARSAALPMLSGIASGSRNFMIAEQMVKFGDQPPVSIKFGQENQAVYGLSATQTIFEGRVFSAIRASKVYDNITEFAFKVSTLGVEEKTITAFYSALVAVEVMEVMKSSLDRAKSNLEKTLLIFSMGKTSELDKIRAETNVARRESELINAKKNSQIALEYFKRIIGYPISDELTIIGELNSGAIFSYNYEKLQEVMLINQPAISQAGETIHLMKENISAVRSEFIPSLYLTGSYQSLKIYDDGQFSNEEFRNSQSVSLNLNIPIFKGYGSTARLGKAKAEYRKSQYRHYDLEENMKLELKKVLLNLESLGKKIASGGKELELAQKGHKTAEALLESGRISQLDMEDSELTLMQAELGLLQYKLEYQTSMAALERIIGRKDLTDAYNN